MGERLLCKQDVIGSIPVSSTILSKGIEAETRLLHRENLLEIESLLPEYLRAQTLILELASSPAQCRVALQHLLPQTIFDN